MKKLRIYLDTSIISFFYADDAPEKREITREFFEKFINEYDVYISKFVVYEIEKNKDKYLKEKLLDIIIKYNLKTIEFDEKAENEILLLVDSYISNKIISENKREDAFHIAICTFFEFDILLSWNFRHLANIKKQIKINILNELNGYFKKLNLLNPMEVIYEE